VGQHSGAEWVGTVARTLLAWELATGSGLTPAEMVEQVVDEVQAWERAADEAARDARTPVDVLPGADEDSGWDEDEDDACEGHESLAGEHMGEAVYCDGSCRRARRA
jgi:hypothetical protein